MHRSLLLLAFLVPSALAQADLQDASLEQLMQIQVRSVSKKDQKLSRVAAAVFVLTQEDIRRSGATSIPEVLRLIPGVQVARMDAGTWAISIRGFNSRFSNKVLVLIDGRTVYDASFSGVSWDHQDIPLEQISRIEVIRGSGGSVWGANAVNGVISITTKTAWATKGSLISAGGGSFENTRGLVQYGGQLGPKGAFRAYARGRLTGDSALPNGAPAGDGWSSVGGGFRADWDLTRRDSVTLQADGFHNSGGHTIWSSFLGGPDTLWRRAAVSSGNVLARWERTLSETSDVQLQLYVDHLSRDEMGVLQSVSAIDVDFQHRLALGPRHDVVWGVGYRATNSGARGHASALSMPYRTDPLPSTFLQDEIILGKSLWLTLGAKIEHNSYTGVEYEPSARLAWMPTRNQTIWAAASRSIRQPARAETSVTADLGTMPLAPGIVGLRRLIGDPNLRAEDLRDYEVGYRVQLSNSLSLDSDAYGGLYHHLQQILPGQPAPWRDQPGVQFLIPVMYRNSQHARAYGGEFFATYEVTPRWRISPGYAFALLSATKDIAIPGASLPGWLPPKHSGQVRSLLTLPRNVEFDVALYHMSRLTEFAIPAYTRVDVRVGWRLNESTELSVAGQNLLRPRHLEFYDPAMPSTQAERSVYAKILWHF